MPNPFFSVIVVSFNARDTIRRTIESVLSQDFDNYEIIVKDAASTDGTVDEIPDDDRIKTYINSDKGIYYGMNEAVSYASGEYLLFLNCGDYFASDTVLSEMYKIASKNNPDTTVIYGNYSRKGVVFKQPSKLTPFYLYRTPLCHQTVFFGKGVFDKFEGYNVDYTILADYDLTLKSYFGGFKFVYCPVVVSDYFGGGVSESKKGIEKKKNEYKVIHKLYYSKLQIIKYRITVFFTFKKLRQKLISDRSPEWIRKLYRKVVNKANG